MHAEVGLITAEWKKKKGGNVKATTLTQDVGIELFPCFVLCSVWEEVKTQHQDNAFVSHSDTFFTLFLYPSRVATTTSSH